MEEQELLASKQVNIKLKIILYVFICFYMFLYVFICFYMFLYVFICFYMFLYH
jgi:hypothetical protein